jgi:hypothetical protein
MQDHVSYNPSFDIVKFPAIGRYGVTAPCHGHRGLINIARSIPIYGKVVPATATDVAHVSLMIPLDREIVGVNINIAHAQLHDSGRFQY